MWEKDGKGSSINDVTGKWTTCFTSALVQAIIWLPHNLNSAWKLVCSILLKISIIFRLASLALGTTVKLGYNDQGYNEFMAITNKIYWY